MNKPINEMTNAELIDHVRNGLDTFMRDDLDLLLAERLENKHRWIPVSEQLPDEDFDYVHVYYDGMVATMCYSKPKGFHGATANRMEMFAHEITHWRRIDGPEGL